MLLKIFLLKRLLRISSPKNKVKYICSVYKERPEVCHKYPWNHANRIFEECIFYDKEKRTLRSIDQQALISTPKEINDYCVGCGRCCFYGPAACSKLIIEKD